MTNWEVSYSSFAQDLIYFDIFNKWNLQHTFLCYIVMVVVKNNNTKTID